jgi:hypothetical protein
LWDGKGQLGKGTQAIQGFCEQVLTKGEFWRKKWSVVEHQEFFITRRFEHKFLGPYSGPFKMLEKKFPNVYKLELPENLRVHPTFHFSLLKSVAHDAWKPNRKQNSRPPPDLVHNEPEFEVEVVLKSRQLRGWKREYLVKWKRYHPIKASWVNESDMEHAQETIEEFHTRPAKKQKKRRMWWGHHLSFSGAGSHINVPHQVTSEIKAKNFQEIVSWT